MLVLAGLLFFGDFLFSSKNFYFRDILNFHYPLRRVLIDTYARGELPLWNPFVYLGQPMLANPNYMAFYPTNLLHLFLTFNYAFKLHFILHPLLGGLGLYFLQKRLGIGPLPALGGALAYQFSGTVLSFLNLYNIVPAVGLMPWIGWAFWRALKGNRGRDRLLFGALVALQVIAFEPLIFQCNFWFLAGLSFLHWSEAPNRGKAAREIIHTGLTGAALGLGLAAVQLVPSIELLQHSARARGLTYTVASRWSMHPMDFLNVIIPNLFGNYYSIGYATSWGEPFHHGSEGVLVSFFLGSTALLLASLSFAHARRKLVIVLASVSVVSILLALGRYNPLYEWLYDHVALIRFGRYPSKYFLLTTLMLSIMVSLGLDVILRCQQDDSRRRRHLLATGAGGLVLSALVIGLFLRWRADPMDLERIVRAAVEAEQLADKDFPFIVSHLRSSILACGIFASLCGLMILLALYWRRVQLLTGLLLATLSAELIPANLQLSPSISDADVDFVPEIDRFILQSGGRALFRVVPPNWLEPLPNRLRAPNRSLAWLSLFYRMSGQTLGGIPRGIQYSLDASVDLLNTFESEQMYKQCLLLPEAKRIALFENINSPALLALGNIRDPRAIPVRSFDTLSRFRLNFYWLGNALPRAYFAQGVSKASSHQEALGMLLLPTFSVRDTVILEDREVEARAGQPAMGEARVVDYRSGRVVVEVAAGAAGYLVLLDTYYPGWRAYRDGAQVPVRRANYAFRAVDVPAGTHRVEFRYQPRSFYLGLAVTALSLVMGLFVMVLEGRSSRRSAPSSAPAREAQNEVP